MTLRLSRFLLNGIGKKQFHTTKCTSLFYEPPDKGGMRLKSEDEEEWEKLSWKEKIKLELQLCKEGLQDYYKTSTDNASEGIKAHLYEHQVELIHRFTGDKKELNNWVISADKDYNQGFSTAQLDLTRDSKGVFYGFLDTKLPPDGKMKNTGFVNLKHVPHVNSFHGTKAYEWGPYTHLVFRIRGDGRVYSVNLHLNTVFDVTSYDTYHYFIWTRGGPYWQYIRIPFSKFFFAYKGRLQAWNKPLPPDLVNAVSFTLADKITGPFKLEIDYVGIEYDPFHIEESAYETYDWGDHKFW